MNRSINQWINELMNQWIIVSMNKSINQLINESTNNWWINAPTNQWISELTNWWINKWINEPIKQENQCIKEPINQWISQSINYLINTFLSMEQVWIYLQLLLNQQWIFPHFLSLLYLCTAISILHFLPLYSHLKKTTNGVLLLKHVLLKQFLHSMLPYHNFSHNSKALPSSSNSSISFKSRSSQKVLLAANTNLWARLVWLPYLMVISLKKKQKRCLGTVSNECLNLRCRLDTLKLTMKIWCVLIILALCLFRPSDIIFDGGDNSSISSKLDEKDAQKSPKIPWNTISAIW